MQHLHPLPEAPTAPAGDPTALAISAALRAARAATAAHRAALATSAGSQHRRAAARAFTLVELIVVIVILGVLVALGTATYNTIVDGERGDSVERIATQVGKSVQARSATDQVPVLSTLGTLADGQGPWSTDLQADAAVTDTSWNNITVVRSGYCAKLAFNTNTVGSQFTVSNGVAGTSC